MQRVARGLRSVLKSLGESSLFCTSGTLDAVLPGLEVENVGLVSLPVTQSVARKLIREASPAPYGRGEETLVDPGVRRVWQLEPKQFSICNPEWDSFISRTVEEIRVAFAIDRKPKSDLYKLLVYEKGCFFTPHRDSEKRDGMFATLVVCLPARHKGGALVIRHDGETKTIDFGGDRASYAIQYAAFYADCEHEIKPVTQGHRVCLIYNLALPRRKVQPAPPRTSAVVATTEALLSEWFASESATKIVIPFAHQYTEASFGFETLKGADRSEADILLRATDRLSYQIHFALMTRYEMGEIDYESVDPGDRWSKPDLDSASMGELYEKSICLDYWIDRQGREVDLGEMRPDEGEILCPHDVEGSPFNQEIHEATGNEGVTMERWYRQAVAVIWPEDRFHQILSCEGQACALPRLERLIAHQKNASGSAECRHFAELIMESWQPPASSWEAQKSSKSAVMLECLERIGDVDLANRFISDILTQDYAGTEGPLLSRLCRKLGWERFAGALRRFFKSQSPDNNIAGLDRVVAIFQGLCCTPPRVALEQRVVCRELAAEVERVVESWDRLPEREARRKESESRDRVVSALFRSLVAIEDTGRLNSILSHVFHHPQRYGLREVLIPAVRSLRPSMLKKKLTDRKVFRELLQHCIAGLESATAVLVQEPTDWTRSSTTDCRCEDCTALQRFLRNPRESVLRFSIRKDRRRHLHQQIDRHRLDVDHVTERRGSPYTLVCTKNQAAYERKKKQLALDTRLLKALNDDTEELKRRDRVEQS